MNRKLRYIIGISFIIIMVIRIKEPNIITIPKISLDTLNIILLIIGIGILSYPLLVKLLKNIINILSIKLVVSFFCFILVIIRMFNKEIVIDTSSVYLIIIATIVALIPDVKDVFDRLKKIKTNNFELEFTLEDLLGKVEKVEKKIEKNMDDCLEEEGYSKLNYGGLDSSLALKFEKVAGEPNALILMIGVEMETRIYKLISDFEIKEIGRPPAFNGALKKLYELKIIDKDSMNLIREFRNVRNMVAHGVYKKDEISQKQLYTVAEIGIRVLKVLPTEIES